MSHEHQQRNIESWKALTALFEDLDLPANRESWRSLAQRFLREGDQAGLNRYFRAGSSMNDLIFSTLDHHGLKDEPRVIVRLLPDDQVYLAFRGKGSMYLELPEIEYTLPFDLAAPTFRRFLSQLWMATMPEGLPLELRGHTAPVLPGPSAPSDQLARRARLWGRRS